MALNVFLMYTLFYRHDLPFPVGICSLFNCACLTLGYPRIITIVALVVLEILYILEIGAMWCSLLLFLIAVVILTIEESNGSPSENGILSLVFFAQFLAYFLNKFNLSKSLSKNRMQFSAQIFAAGYVLAGISKLHVSGLAWFTTDAPNFALEVMRNFNSKYITYGNIWYYNRGIEIADFVLNHIIITKILLGFSVMLELCAFVLMLGKRLSFVYSFLLLFLHVGIYLTLDIIFPSITVPLIIFFINPLYWILIVAEALYQKMSFT